MAERPGPPLRRKVKLIVMTTAAKEIFEAALKLDPADRAHVAHGLLESLDAAPDEDATQEDDHRHHGRRHEQKHQLFAIQLDLMEAVVRYLRGQIAAILALRARQYQSFALSPQPCSSALTPARSQPSSRSRDRLRRGTT